MVPKTILIALAGLCLAFVLADLASAQSPCPINFPDSCRDPGIYCNIPWEHCPWTLNQIDIGRLFAYFKGGPIPPIFSKYDVNCNGVVSGLDVVYFVRYGRDPSRMRCCIYQCEEHAPSGSIGDRVWNDSDHNGIWEHTEPGIAGVLVELTDCDTPPTVITSDVTDSNGYYLLDSLSTGEYRIHFNLPNGYQFSPMDQGSNDSNDSDADPSTGYTGCDTFYGFEHIISIDAGMYLVQNTGAIGDRVWQDANRNGIQDSGEVGLANVPVDLMDCEENPTVLASDTTNADGCYLFEGLRSGSYRLQFWRTDEYSYSPINQGSNDQLDSDVDLLTGQTVCFDIERGVIDTSWDAGIIWPSYHASVGDFVWNDENRNGIQDQGEPGLPGIAVVIRNCDGLPLDTAITDSTGHFLFGDLGTARAYLHFILPDSFRFSPADQGGNDSLDSDVNSETANTVCFDITESGSILNWDAGMYMVAADERCTFSLPWWKNHAGYRHQPDMVSHHLPLWVGFYDGVNSIHITDNQAAIDILRITGQYGLPNNGLTRLYAELLAAKLNIANGADDSAVAVTLSDADNIIGVRGWREWPDLSGDDQRFILNLVNTLERYNRGQIGPGSCIDNENNNGEKNEGDF